MKITNLNIKNKSISLENISLDFSARGVHLIDGENGSGKTSLIKGILYNKDAKKTFLNEYENNIYKKTKYKLIANVEQEQKNIQIPVYNYITKFNKKIDRKDIEQLLTKFKLDKEILRQKFNKLSGGEQKKIQIISELLKKTKYFILDEPTNNLDDEAISELNKILNELAEEKVLIITSHDERLNLELSSYIKIENNKVIQTINKKEEETHIFKSTYKKRTDYFKQSKDKYLNSNGLGLITNILILMIFLLIITTINFNYKMTSRIIQDKEHIAQINNNTYSQIVKDFEKYHKIKIEEDERKLLNFDKVEEISKKKGVLETYIYEREKYDKALMNEKPKNKEDLKFIEINSELNTEFKETMSLYTLGLDLTLKGSNYPKINYKEVATSMYNLENFYNFSKNELENPIGKKITLNPFGIEEEYTISGIIKTDYLLISYEESEKYSIYYKYNEKTYSDFLARNTKYIEDNELSDYYKEFPDEVLFKVDENSEFEITKEIYNSSGLGHIFGYSSFFASNKVEQEEVFFNKLPATLIITSILSILIACSATTCLIAQRNLLNNIDNYYLSKNKQKRISIYTIISFLFIGYLLIIPFNLINQIYFEWFLLSETIGLAMTFVTTVIALTTTYFIICKKK